MNKLDVSLLQGMFQSVADTIIDKEPYLTEIDTIIGDGDHGTGMKRGFTAVRKLLKENTYTSVSELCRAVSIELIRSMGGASGVIFGTMFFGGISNLPDSNEVTVKQLAAYFYDGEKAIEKRGKSSPGEKTMLDALWPAVVAMKEYAAEEDADIITLFEKAWYASIEGAKASKDLMSKRGRSSNFGDQCIGLPDPGAMSTSFIFEAMYRKIIKLKGFEEIY